MRSVRHCEYKRRVNCATTNSQFLNVKLLFRNGIRIDENAQILLLMIEDYYQQTQEKA